MPDARYPTLEEFWERMTSRELESDLQQALRDRAGRERGSVTRVGDEATVVAVAARMLPGAVPPQVLAAFLDAVFDQQLGRGDDQANLLPREELIPAGFEALTAAARDAHGMAFAELAADQQDELLHLAERGELPGPDGFGSSTWFKRVRESFLLAFGSDPRGMVQMGFPGPSYRPGYIWLDLEEVQARADRKPGYQEL